MAGARAAKNRCDRRSPFREDGVTFGTPTWIWSMVVEGALYVRAYNGKKSRWYQAAMGQKVGQITTASVTKQVVMCQSRGRSTIASMRRTRESTTAAHTLNL
jgi:hypothetical protein